MFNGISGRYDFLDHLLSFRLDYRWRKILAKKLAAFEPKNVLDVATGTADLAITIAKICTHAKVTGVDISEKMLEIGNNKINNRHLSSRIQLLSADAENLPFDDDEFDAVTVSFGVRNFENLENGLTEIQRVLKPGGHILILEFSLPTNPVFKLIYSIYFTRIVPFLGRLFTRNPFAYRYLQGSVKEFPYGNQFAEILRNLNFQNIRFQQLSCGICTLYYGRKS